VSRRLRVANPSGEHFEAGFANTARKALEQALADGAIVLDILYETPAGVRHIAVPNSRAVSVGLHNDMTDILHPDTLALLEE
jgi:hypothetical protein